MEPSRSRPLEALRLLSPCSRSCRWQTLAPRHLPAPCSLSQPKAASAAFHAISACGCVSIILNSSPMFLFNCVLCDQFDG